MDDDDIISKILVSNSNLPPFYNLNFLGGMDQNPVLLGQASLVDHEFQFGLGPPPDNGLEVDFGLYPVGDNLKDVIYSIEIEKGEKEDSPALGLCMERHLLQAIQRLWTITFGNDKCLR